MSTFITENGNVFYENEPQPKRTLWKNEPNTNKINEIIDKINSSKKINGTPTNAITTGLLTAFKDGACNSVRVSMYATNNNESIPINTPIFNIPTTIAPRAERIGVPAMFVLQDGTVAPYYIIVNTDGSVTQSFSSSVKNIFSCGEYSL